MPYDGTKLPDEVEVTTWTTDDWMDITNTSAGTTNKIAPQSLFSGKEFGDLTIENIVHDMNIGINVSPSYSFHVKQTSESSLIVAERDSGTIIKVAATSTFGQIGTVTADELKFITGNTERGLIDASGNVQFPVTYTTIIGGTNVDLYIDNTGLLGPLPSFLELKENIRELTDQDTSWIYNIPVKMCDYKDGTLNQITVIAEEAESIHPEVIRYAPFEITESGPIMINQTEYKGIEKIQELINPGEEKDVELDKIFIDNKGDESIQKIIKRVKLSPFTTNKSDFIYPMLHELQKKNLVIEDLSTRIIELEKKAGISL